MTTHKNALQIISIVIVGIGDGFRKHYFPTLRKLKSDNKLNNCIVSCIDHEKSWGETGGENYIRKSSTRDEIISLNEEPGSENCKFEYVDRFTDRHRQLIYESEVDLVMIVVEDKYHYAATKEWIQGNCLHICVEKPLSVDKQGVNDFLGFDKNELKRISAVDHYRGKLHMALSNKDFFKSFVSVLRIPDSGDFQLKRFRFFCIEDFSGTDEKYLRKENIPEDNSNCPIRMVGRETALEKGMTFDLLPHMFATLMYFGFPESVKIDRIWAGKYVGVDYQFNQSPEVDDTFVALHFRFKQQENKQEVIGEAYAGKGILGVEEFHQVTDLEGNSIVLDGDVKVFEIEGVNGVKVQVFMKQKLQRILIPDQKPIIKSFPIEDPFSYTIEQSFSPAPLEESEQNLHLEPEMAAEILNKIFEIKEKIDGKSLPNYSLGMRNSAGEVLSRPQYLEHMLESFGDPVWDRDSNKK